MRRITRRMKMAATTSAVAAAALVHVPVGASQDAAVQPHFAVPVGMAEAFQPDFLRRDVQIMVEHFRMDEGQQAIVESIFDGYEQAFNEGVLAVRQELDAVRPTAEQQQRIRQHNHDAIRRRLEELVDRMRELQESDTREAQDAIEELKLQARELKDRMREGDGAAMEVDLLRQLMADFDAIIGRWETRKALLLEEFLADVRLVLSEEQQAQWPAFERKLRRVKLLSKGELSGESTDLLALVRQLGLTPDQRAAVQATIDEFEIALDNALVARRDFLRQTRNDRATLLQGGDRDAAAALVATESGFRVAVRDTNHRYAESLAETLGGELGASLADRFNRTAYAKAFRPTRADRAFDAMLQLPELDEAVRTSLESLAMEYRNQLDGSRSAIIALIRQYEPQEHQQRFVLQVLRASGIEPAVADDNPMFAAFAALHDQDEQYIERALAMLTPEQIEVLPAYVKLGTRWASTVRPAGHPDGAPATPEERRAFAATFDENGDGRLDAVERDKLRRALQDLYGNQPSSRPR